MTMHGQNHIKFKYQRFGDVLFPLLELMW